MTTLSEETIKILDNYNRTTDPLQKKDYIEQLLQNNAGEENLYRKHIWEARYCKNGTFIDQDAFLNALLELSCQEEKLTSFLFKRKALKTMHSICSSLLLDQPLSPIQVDVLYHELKNVVSIYIELCRSDKKYGSVLMGLGTLKEADLSYKIAKQIYTIVCGTARICHMEAEFALLSQAGRDSFCSYFPDDTDSWELAKDDFEKRYHIY